MSHHDVPPHGVCYLGCMFNLGQKDQLLIARVTGSTYVRRSLLRRYSDSRHQICAEEPHPQQHSGYVCGRRNEPICTSQISPGPCTRVEASRSALLPNIPHNCGVLQASIEVLEGKNSALS